MLDWANIGSGPGVVANVATLGMAGAAAYGAYLRGRKKWRYWFPGDPSWKDMCQHGRVQGMPGSGKSTLLQHMALEQMQAGRGVFVFDPHGSLAQAVLRIVPPEKRLQTVYHAPAVQPLGLNVLRLTTGSEAERAEVADSFLSLLRHLTAGWGVVQDSKLEECLWTVLGRPNPSMKALLREVEATEDKGLYARVSRLVASPALAKSMEMPPIPLEQIMAQGGVYLLDLSGLGERTADIYYRLHTVRVLQAAWARGEHSRGMLLICDEAQRARRSSEALERMLAECRKFGVSVTLAHHMNAQLGDGVTEMYNLLGTQYLFRMSPRDARDAQHIAAPYDWQRLCHLPNYTCLRRRQIHGGPEQPHIVHTKPPPKPTMSEAEAKRIMQRSAELYGAVDGARRIHSKVSRQAQGGNTRTATGEVVSKLPDGKEAPALTPSVRPAEAVQLANGSDLRNSVLPI